MESRSERIDRAGTRWARPVVVPSPAQPNPTQPNLGRFLLTQSAMTLRAPQREPNSEKQFR